MASLSQPIRLEEGEEDQSPEPCANLSPSRSRGDFPLGQCAWAQGYRVWPSAACGEGFNLLLLVFSTVKI